MRNFWKDIWRLSFGLICFVACCMLNFSSWKSPIAAQLPKGDPPSLIARGWIEQADTTIVKGWLCVKDLHPSQILLQIYVAEEYKGTVTASIPRPDVIGSRYPECGHEYIGFHVGMPQGTKAGSSINIMVHLLTDPPLRLPFPTLPGLATHLSSSTSTNPQQFSVLQHKRAIPIHISKDEPRRLNILMCGLGRDLTGGPLSILHFANLAVQSGIKVRWINVDGAGIKYPELMSHLQNYQHLSEFSKVEFHWDAFNNPPIPTNPNDLFMATIYFTAFIAHSTSKLLKNPNIIYFIQDYEPIFFSHNSDYLEAQESYIIPHFPIFSTPMLDVYFRENNYGIYRKCGVTKYHSNFVHSSQPAIKTYKPFDPANHPPERVRTLVAYARSHAPRNAYDLAVAVLSEAIRNGIFGDPKKWSFVGLGALSHGEVCNLGGYSDICLKLLANTGENEYFKLLASADVGLSLMLSPHPSLPPFDFAAAGIVTLTNSFETKTSQSFKPVSENIIVVEPYFNSLLEGLRTAVKQCENMESRLRGSKLNWSRKWDDENCYGSKLFTKIKSWFDIHTPVYDHICQLQS